MEWTRGFTTGGYSSFQAQTYIRDFFGGIGGTRWNDVVTQYCDNVPKGTQDCSAVAGAVTITNQAGQLKGEWNDITLVPSAPSQTDIAKAAKRLAAHFGDPPGGVFLVFSPSGKSMPGFGTQYCAWHSDTQNLAYAYIPYMPDQGTAGGTRLTSPTTHTATAGSMVSAASPAMSTRRSRPIRSTVTAG